MSYPPEPPAGWPPGGGPTVPAGYGGTDSQTRPLPPGVYADPTAVYPQAGHEPGYDPGYGGGYRDPGYGDPVHGGGYDPGGPPGNDRNRVLKRVIIGVVVVLAVAGGGFYAAYAFTQNAFDGPSKVGLPALPTPPPVVPSAEAPPSEEPSPTPTPEQTTAAPPSAPFQDDELRRFAGRVAKNADRCTSENAASFADVTEAVTCQVDNGFTVRYLKFSSRDARDSYTGRVRDGLNGQLDVKRDSFWNADGKRQGRFVAGSQNDNNTQYIYWNVFDDAVSGELIAQSDSRKEVERFWRREL